MTVWRFLHVSGGISQVAVWLPIKNEPWLLNYRLALLAMMAVLMCHSPLSLSKSLCPPPSHRRLASLSLFPSHLLLPSSLYPSISRLTAIRHWPCSLCLLPLPQVQPSHNYFLWFTVVGHCHPPKVFTAEITHTASQPDLPPLFHYPLLCPEALVNTGLIKNPDIQREQFFLNGRGVAI